MSAYSKSVAAAKRAAAADKKRSGAIRAGHSAGADGAKKPKRKPAAKKPAKG